MIRKIVFSKLFNRHDTYSTEIQFEVFRWMLLTGWEYRVDKGGEKTGVFEQLYDLSSVNSLECFGFYNDKGFSSLEYDAELRTAFVRAIISQDCLPCVKEWREKNGIFLGKYRYLNLKISDDSKNETWKKLWVLFNAHKVKLAVQLNEYWPQAVNIDSVLISPDREGWRAFLRYGFDGSFWTYCLVKQKEKSFADFLDDACTELYRITGKDLFSVKECT